MSEWQSIETAPKRTPVLVYTSAGMCVAECRDRPEDWFALVNGCYIWDGADERADLVAPENPTHWMPLPAAPESKIKTLDDLTDEEREQHKAMMWAAWQLAWPDIWKGLLEAGIAGGVEAPPNPDLEPR